MNTTGIKDVQSSKFKEIQQLPIQLRRS